MAWAIKKKSNSGLFECQINEIEANSWLFCATKSALLISEPGTNEGSRLDASNSRK